MDEEVTFENLRKSMVAFYEDAIEAYDKSEHQHLETGFTIYQVFSQEKFEFELKNLFLKLYRGTEDSNYYWFLCKHQIYERCYQSRMEEYLKKYSSAIEKDFIEEEMILIKKSFSDNEIYWFHSDFERYEMYFRSENTTYRLFFLDNDTKKNIGFDVKKKLDFLKSILQTQELSPDNYTNPHPEIFSGHVAFHLFKYFIENMPKTNADLSYIYRRMSQDDRIDPDIFCSGEQFKEFVKTEYNIGLSKLKTLDEVDIDERRGHYNSLSKAFKIKLNNTGP